MLLQWNQIRDCRVDSMLVTECFQIKYCANQNKIIILLMELCLLNLHVLHCAVIPLWDGIMMKILFRYSLIISQAQLADKLRLPVLTRILEISLAAFSLSITGQLQYLWEGPCSGKTQFYSLAISFPPLYSRFFFFFFNETPPRKSLKHLSV